jgi:hypothetical protein
MIKIKKLSYIMILLTLVTFSNALVTGTTATWAEDFDDGDLTDWEIVGHDWRTGNLLKTQAGNASIVNGELWTNGSNPDVFTLAGYPNSINYGEWKFSMLTTQTARVSFASDIPKINLTAEEADDLVPKKNGYYLILSITGFELKREGATLANYEVLGITGNWQHIVITRDLSDRITVSINGTVQLNVTDSNGPQVSHYFKLITDTDARLDNVIVTKAEPDTDATQAPGFEFIPLLLSLFVATTAIIYRKRR